MRHLYLSQARTILKGKENNPYFTVELIKAQEFKELAQSHTVNFKAAVISFKSSIPVGSPQQPFSSDGVEAVVGLIADFSEES